MSDLQAESGPVIANDKTVISKRPCLAEGVPPTEANLYQLGESLVGKRLEYYDLTEFVGGGGMGAVFRAIDTRLGREVAVKVLSRDHTDEETIRRFRNEAQSAARLDHPNIARVYSVGEDHGWNFIVFEFIEGTNLRDTVERDGPLDLHDALRYTLQVAQAIEHSSNRDVVHRDIKPSNVLVTAAGQAKLVDMGLARLHQVESPSNDLTASGVTLGTFDYISPEQARDPRAADVRSDIYSLGCTLYYMLTGQPPFPEGTALQKLIRHSSDEPPDPRVFRPELPPQVSMLIARLLAKRPADRQQSAAELIGDIVALAQELGFSDLGSPGAVARPAAGRDSLFWTKTWQVVAAIALLVAGIVLLDSYVASRSASDGFTLRPKFKEPSAAAIDPPQSEQSDGGTPSNSSQPTNAQDAELARRSAQVVPSQRLPPATGDRLPRAPARPGSVADSQLPQNSSDDDLNISPPLSQAGVHVEPLDAEISATVAEGLPSPAESVSPKRIVVSPQSPATAEADAEYVSTVQEGCRRAAALGLNDVELRWNGPLVEKPFDVVASRLALRAAIGYRPVVVFQPSAEQRQMIRLAGGMSRLSLQGVEVRMELPADPADGWSLVSMGTGQTLELSGCVLTVQDNQEEQHDNVAIIGVQPRRVSDTMTMMDPQLAMGQSASVTLDRSIARGEATLISLADEAPLTLHWKQGLLATSRRLIETGGTATSPKWFEKIDLDLESVTAYCRQGLHHMRRAPGKSHQFALNVSAKHCILMTEPDVPLYEFVGMSSLLDEDLQAIGDYNRYPFPDVVFLRVRSGVPGESPQDFALDRCQWSTESHSQVGIPWLRPLSRTTPAHRLTKNDFATDTTIPIDAGFDPDQLPDAP